MTSCKKDWFEVKPDKSLTVPASLKDLEGLLDNATLLNSQSPALGEVGSDGHYMPELYWGNELLNEERNAYTWTYNLPYTNSKEWITSYLKIYYCNLVLEGLNKITPSSPAEKEQWNNCMGNALFIRAYTFYDLSQVYAPPYFDGAGAEFGIPLRLESDIALKSIRSTVKETYDQIINDLNKAKDLLSIHPLYKTRGSKPAALGLLARCYLSMENYEMAGQSANACLSLYNNLLNYNTLDSTANVIGIFNVEVIFHSTLANYAPAYIPGALAIDKDLYYLYKIDDLRRPQFFRVASDSTISFKGRYNRNSLQFSGLATDEMYLIRAECNARANKVSAAMDDLNTLLFNRWRVNQFKEFEAKDQEEALKQILLERRKELLLRGLRWSDLRRLNRDPKFAVTLSRTIGGKTYTLEPGSYKYTLPIPDDVIGFSGMQQNIGWKK